MKWGKKWVIPVLASGPIFSQHNNNNKFLSFTVKDNGVGISKQKIQHIFEPFSQAETDENSKIKGTGLGLTIAKAYTELLGGSIHVKSEEGKGATFTFNVLQDYLLRHIQTQMKLNVMDLVRFLQTKSFQFYLNYLLLINLLKSKKKENNVKN